MIRSGASASKSRIRPVVAAERGVIEERVRPWVGGPIGSGSLVGRRPRRRSLGGCGLPAPHKWGVPARKLAQNRQSSWLPRGLGSRARRRRRRLALATCSEGAVPATEPGRFLLVRRPTGVPAPEDFNLVSEPLPDLADGEFLIRNH